MFNKINEKLQNISEQIQRLPKKDLEKYIIIILATTSVVLGGIIYYIYNTSMHLTDQIKRTSTLASKSVNILKKYEALQEEENRLQDLLAKHKDFNVKIYFEQFCKEQNITPEPGWNTTVDTINEKFEEVTLPASFKGQTTEKLVTILEKLNKNELLYIKYLAVRAEKNTKKITFDITLATKRIKGS